MEHLFDDILEKDEKIIKVIKPSKRRYWKLWLMPLVVPIFLPHFIIVMAATLFFILPVIYARGYKNLYYAYTNKRLIVRSGIIGVDYHSLEYKDISATSVNVDFLDKSRKGTTGTIYFKSPSSSITFHYVENPYDLMREIKDYIASQNEEQEKL